MRNINRLKTIIAIVAISSVIGIVFLANQGQAARYFGFLYAYPGGDTVAHFAILGTLTFIVTVAFPRDVRIGKRRLPVAPLVILAVITLEELSQGIMPGRTLSLSDWLANLAGVIVGGMAGWWLATRARPLEEH